jgi:hypothetical protein
VAFFFSVLKIDSRALFVEGLFQGNPHNMPNKPFIFEVFHHFPNKKKLRMLNLESSESAKTYVDLMMKMHFKC